MKRYFLIFASLFFVKLSAQVDNTMYGLYQTVNPSGFQFGTIDPTTGVVSTIGNAVLSNAVNSSGAALNPYNQTFSYQDEDSWLSINLQTGEIVNDVMVSLPNMEGTFDNFRFNAADSSMYGLFRQISYDPITGSAFADIRLATCDLTTGIVSLISPNSVAESYTMSGCTIDPFLMVYYFESEDKFTGIDLYNGQIYSSPLISLPEPGMSFGNYAYSCADTSVYGLIMQDGLKSLGKINPQTGVVTALPTLLNFDNYVSNSGGAIDPVNLVYYFQTLDNIGVKMVGLSLVDGSVASESYVSTNGDYFIMYRIQSDCYVASRARLNYVTMNQEINRSNLNIYPNPAPEVLQLKSDFPMTKVEILDAFGKIVNRYNPNSSNLQIPLESLNSGIYFLRISYFEGFSTRRFVKKLKV